MAHGDSGCQSDDIHLGEEASRFRWLRVLDKEYTLRAERVESQGIPRDNITVWSRNGIEYVYPRDLVASVFSCDAGELEKEKRRHQPPFFS